MSVYLLQRLRVPSSNDSVSLVSEAALLPGFLLGLGSPPVVIDQTRSRVPSPTTDETKDLITATADHCSWSQERYVFSDGNSRPLVRNDSGSEQDPYKRRNTSLICYESDAFLPKGDGYSHA
jgi:hypothetical protein